MKLKHTEPYAPLRAAAYPSTGDQLDALFKLVLAMHEQGTKLPPETIEWLNKCRAIKSRYPEN